jgi:hypothetical protein
MSAHEVYPIEDVETINFYHRPLHERNLLLIADLKERLKEHQAQRSNSSYGKFHRSRFLQILSLASRAFNAESAERLSEYVGVSATTVRKMRRGYMPSTTTEFFVTSTLSSACDFYLNMAKTTEDASEAADWVKVPNSVHAMIGNISRLLSNVVVLARGTNVPDSALSPIERAELIAVLETALLMLKAPLVEKGFLKRLKSTLSDVSKRVAERQVELALSAACAAAGSALGPLLLKVLS